MFTQKYIIIFLFLLLSSATFSQTDKDFFQDMIDAERNAHRGLIDYRFNELTTDYNIKYHRFDWEIDPGVLYIKGSVETLFEVNANNFSTLHFDLSTQMQVDSVIYYGQSISFSQEEPDLLVINLPETLAIGDQKSIKVYYQGEPGGSGFGSFAQGIHDGTPAIWTLSEPYGAKDWWPSKQDLNDKIDSIDIYVTTPLPNRVASNGLLVDSLQNGNDMTYHWKHRYPIPAYLIAVSVTNYTIYNQYVQTDGDPILISNYVYPEELGWAQFKLEDFPPFMELFNDLFILYPFADEKYGHARFGWGGGMEHTTMTFMGGWSPGLQAHELAHQWFGDMVTCGSWQDIWLNEGFATYLEGLTQEHNLGENTWMNWKQQKINHITSSPGGSVMVDDTTSVSRIFNGRLSYSKGAMLLHMLRWKLGDDDFFQALRNYLTDPELAYGYARTPDLIAHLESQSGQDLVEFFNDWYYGQGYPSYQINWWQNDDNVLSVEIFQTTSHESVDLFEMPVPIRLSGGGGSTILTFNNDINGQSFSVPLDFEVEMAEFDPDRWLVAKSSLTVGTREKLLPENSLSLFPNPAGEIVQIAIKNAALPIEAIRVFGHTGKLVLNKNYQNLHKIDLNVSQLPIGNYAVEVITKEGIGVVKMTKI